MHAPKIELRAHTYQYTTETHLPQGCTILLDDKTMAIDEFIKWVVKSIGFKALLSET